MTVRKALLVYSAAQSVPRLDDGNAEAMSEQNVGASKTCKAGADNSDMRLVAHIGGFILQESACK
jgi:hypothetical protein